jgi:hypothetical protein
MCNLHDTLAQPTQLSILGRLLAHSNRLGHFTASWRNMMITA